LRHGLELRDRCHLFGTKGSDDVERRGSEQSRGEGSNPPLQESQGELISPLQIV
jgi:hypothetical protein